LTICLKPYNNSTITHNGIQVTTLHTIAIFLKLISETNLGF